jgi:MoxR-like ATPase
MEEASALFAQRFQRLRDAMGQVIVGQQEALDGILTCLVADGHVLLEGVPGLGKTLMVRTLAQALSLDFARIQFTPDLMPADIIGTHIINEDEQGGRSLRFEAGPVFTQVLLADEINRATPKTQSAMLESMQERQVTVAGVRRPLPVPFFVLATQNPLEMEGTYPLPEAQLDRFFYKVLVPFPNLDELVQIVDRTTGNETAVSPKGVELDELLEMRSVVREVPVAEPVKRYAMRLVLATHPDSRHAAETTVRFVRYGSSPRGAQTLILAARVHALLDGRVNVSFDDVRAVALPALRHRLIRNFEGEAEGIEPDDIVTKVVAEVPELTREVAREATQA